MQTKGEYRVGIDFNPSADDTVGRIKSAAADLIDLVEAISPPVMSDDPASLERAREVARLKSLAQTHLEDAAHWAVKAATKPLPN
jgi:hypothetical protein